MNTILVRSLSAMVGDRQRRKARQFFLGLSTDELQYIATFLGACILESEQPYQWSRSQWIERLQRFDRNETRNLCDRDHKMLLLLEFLNRCGGAPTPATARAGLS
ncbi:MAG TPA: hypothetical protein VL285_01075 [Bryobacteraceae bacterium]|jgi:hypothetical protein|nr:hypothetical protein [Bryobacteraceae bacterium]